MITENSYQFANFLIKIVNRFPPTLPFIFLKPKFIQINNLLLNYITHIYFL